MNDKIEQILRTSFEDFFVEAFSRTHPDVELDFAPYLQYVLGEYQRLKKRDRVVINQPPRSLKSWTAKIYAAWYLGRHPSAEVMIVANKQDLAEAIAYDIREILKARWYKKIFPRTEIVPNRSSVAQFKTTRGGGLVACSIESSVAGFGADLLLIDDPNKIDEAERPDRRKKVNEKFDGEICSRLNDKRRGIVLVIQHRLNEDDLSGHLIHKGYKAIVLPLVAPRKKKYALPNGQIWTRQKGEILLASYTQKEVKRVQKISTPSFEWFYQQGVNASRHARLKPEDFELESCAVLTGPPVISIDTAQRGGPSNSYNVAQVWQKTNDGRHHLAHQFRQQCSFTEFESNVVSLIKQVRPAAILIENAAHGAALLSRLQERFTKLKFFPIEPRKSKRERLDAHRNLIRQQTISLPSDAGWVADYIHEFVEFPSSFNDQVDATTQYLDFMATRPLLENAPARAISGAVFGSSPPSQIRSYSSPYGSRQSDRSFVASIGASTFRRKPF